MSGGNTAQNMAEVIVRSAASADIASIYAFSAQQFGIDAADDYHAGLEAALARLEMFPELGPNHPGIRQRIRFLAFRTHHIFYDYDGLEVTIIRILHHAMDVKRHFGS